MSLMISLEDLRRVNNEPDSTIKGEYMSDHRNFGGTYRLEEAVIVCYHNKNLDLKIKIF